MLAEFFDAWESPESQTLDNGVMRKPGLEVPPPPRLKCGLCGINNQGATCYLNSLLQTLLYTPELRESLFCLGEEDLGCLKDGDKSGTKVRIIPIQLQRLFARLLLSNQQSVKTVELTESFGWTNHEELQQHDVQELNRILFSAIEDSLVATSGTHLIQRLYHGSTVNQITCSECNKVSEKEEDFLDLTLAVAGHSGLEDGLKSCFCDVEVMDGKNQYRCGSCNKLVNATKCAKIRCLPQILTISLLRFSFNFQKLERYKETGKYTFPSTINMAPFYEKSDSDKDTEYELFSVVIHRGSAYGGHYFAYIRDVDNLGKWVPPEEEEVQIAPDPSKGKVDFIDCDSPVDVLRILLEQHEKKAMPVDKLHTELTNKTGVSWNKRYKKHYGPISKFFSKYSDTFTLDPVTMTVALKQTGSQHKETTEEKQTETPGNDGKDDVTDVESEWSAQTSGCSQKKKNKNQSPKSVVPPEGHRWFKFDDSHVNSIHAKEIEKQFSGKESAYMLFYRKKSRVGSARVNNPYYGIPEDLVNEVLEENKELDRKRQEYETEVNNLTLQIHFGCNYEFRHGALQPLPDSCTWMELSIDRRKEMSVLLQEIVDLGGELVPEVFVVHRMNQTAAGGHLYDLLSNDCDKQLQQLDITDNTQLFVWNGKEVQKIPVLTGAFNEPIFLTVIYGEQSQINWGFNKSMSLDKLKEIICDNSDIHQNFLQLKQLVGKDSELKAVMLEGDQSSLEDLGLKDGDQLVAENMASKRSNVEQVTIAASNKFLLQVENHCIQTDAEYPKVKVEADKEMSVADLKKLCLKRFGIKCPEAETRMRIDHDTLGLRPPLHEDQCVFEAGVGPGACLVLEYGLAPATDQITLTFTPGEPTSSCPDLEIFVDRKMLVSHCLELMKEKADLPDGHWHLRKTNWCREAAEVLNDLDCTLEDAHVDDGSHLLLEKGKIPAKGNLNLPIWLYPTMENAASSEDSSRAGFFSLIITAIQNLLRHVEEPKAPSRTHPVQIGEIEISKTATLYDLKLQIMTLLIATELTVPSPDFMRLRLVEQGQPATILRDRNQTLQRMKINSGSMVALQLLPEEENLGPNDLVIRIKKRIRDTLDYESELELIWDTSQGASAENLKEAVANALLIPVESLCIAKHLPHKFEWLMIEDGLPNSQGKKNRKKKGKPYKASLCQSPYYIKDGDVIGAKDLSFDPLNKDTFVTIQDLNGKEQLQSEAELKRKEREEKKSLHGEFSEEKKKRRPEVGLSIKVGDFS